MLVFGVGDIVYAYRLAFGDYAVGTWLDALWPVGLVLVALGPPPCAPTAQRTVPGARSLVVVGGWPPSATVVGAGRRAALARNSLPTVLALLRCWPAPVRLVLAFLQLRELAAVRELALTDELTGAANRRALYAALDALLRRRGRRGPTPARRSRWR